MENFRDSQEWQLYDYVGIEENLKQNQPYTYEHDNEHSLIKFYLVASRKPDYFYWNSFFAIFLITTISFSAFSFSYTLTTTRLQPTITLILTSISYKWVVNRSLPPIAYLTILDIYSVFSIFFLSILSCWHVLIGYFHNNIDLTWVDRGFLIGITIIYLIYHIFLIIYLHVKSICPKRRFKKLEKKFKLNKNQVFPFNNNKFI